jgi:hypothetical protein
VKQALVQFPAARYSLEITDHGGAWMGALEDFDNHNNGSDYRNPADVIGGGDPIMSLADMQRALISALGGTRLDILSFDACLMAAQAVAAAFQPIAALLVASEMSVIANPHLEDRHHLQVHEGCTGYSH